MNRPAHKTEGVNRTKAVWFCPFIFTGNDPRKGWRIPLNEIKYNEQRDEETCYGYCNEYQPHAVKRMFDYKNGLFDDRILQRVKRPKREQEKKSFLTETELKKLTSHRLSDEYNNIQKMFLFSCMTGLRYSDVQGLRWKDVKRSGKHLQLEFHQQKTDTYERLPLA